MNKTIANSKKLSDKDVEQIVGGTSNDTEILGSGNDSDKSSLPTDGYGNIIPD